MAKNINKGGRPTVYTREVADLVIDRMQNNETVSAIATDIGIGLMTILGWATEDRDGFRERYEDARRAQAEHMDRQILELANAVTTPANVKMNGLIWRARSLNPKRYSDKVDLTSGGEKLSITISKDDLDE